eukprot:GHVN01079484.1.p1 GENE.GHVN01079484.1~~GHVN01079484.1.p1  ORF type:complete len:711 (-),score=112.80 GHVN01079484.1:1615-3555(-)
MDEGKKGVEGNEVVARGEEGSPQRDLGDGEADGVSGEREKGNQVVARREEGKVRMGRAGDARRSMNDGKDSGVSCDALMDRRRLTVHEIGEHLDVIAPSAQESDGPMLDGSSQDDSEEGAQDVGSPLSQDSQSHDYQLALTGSLEDDKFPRLLRSALSVSVSFIEKSSLFDHLPRRLKGEVQNEGEFVPGPAALAQLKANFKTGLTTHKSFESRSSDVAKFTGKTLFSTLLRCARGEPKCNANATVFVLVPSTAFGELEDYLEAGTLQKVGVMVAMYFSNEVKGASHTTKCWLRQFRGLSAEIPTYIAIARAYQNRPIKVSDARPFVAAETRSAKDVETESRRIVKIIRDKARVTTARPGSYASLRKVLEKYEKTADISDDTVYVYSGVPSVFEAEKGFLCHCWTTKKSLKLLECRLDKDLPILICLDTTASPYGRKLSVGAIGTVDANQSLFWISHAILRSDHQSTDKSDAWIRFFEALQSEMEIEKCRATLKDVRFIICDNGNNIHSAMFESGIFTNFLKVNCWFHTAQNFAQPTKWRGTIAIIKELLTDLRLAVSICLKGTGEAIDKLLYRKWSVKHPPAAKILWELYSGQRGNWKRAELMASVPGTNNGLESSFRLLKNHKYKENAHVETATARLMSSFQDV